MLIYSALDLQWILGHSCEGRPDSICKTGINLVPLPLSVEYWLLISTLVLYSCIKSIVTKKLITISNALIIIVNG